MIDLGTLGGNYSSAVGINSSGQIVGISRTLSGDMHAFLWESGTMVDLGTLGGNSSGGPHINEVGQVVGVSETSSGDQHAFLWESGTMIDLGTLGGDTSFAHGINNAGSVVGQSQTSSGAMHAFLWEHGSMTDLGTLGGLGSSATLITDARRIAGYSDTALGDFGVFVWEDGSMVALDTLGGFYSFPADINAAGHVVGQSWTPLSDRRAALWESTAITNLGTLRNIGRDDPAPEGSYAYAINDAGQIVGESENNIYSQHAFLWQSGTMIDLGSLAFGIGSDQGYSRALAINNVGRIVGESTTLAGPLHPAMWSIITPVAIDIRPGAYPNVINAGSRGLIAVAILATADFDPLDVVNGVDPATVRFAGASKVHPNQPLGHWEDVNGDGNTDLVLHFETSEVVNNPGGLGCGDAEATLTGLTYAGLAIEGVDFVELKPCMP